jgi:hypothetical protein
MPVTYDNIATTTVGSSGTTSTVTFNSIPASWTDLRLVVAVSATGSNGASLKLTFNNVTTTTYSMATMWGDGSSGQNSRFETSLPFIYPNYTTGTSSAYPSLYTFDILSYRNSIVKPVLFSSCDNRLSSGAIGIGAARWSGTSAITRIDVVTNNTTFNAGSTITLFGIKAA